MKSYKLHTWIFCNILLFAAVLLYEVSPFKIIKEEVIYETPEGATALCNDGSYSINQVQEGTCYRHKGVNYWIQKPLAVRNEKIN